MCSMFVLLVGATLVMSSLVLVVETGVAVSSSSGLRGESVIGGPTLRSWSGRRTQADDGSYRPTCQRVARLAYRHAERGYRDQLPLAGEPSPPSLRRAFPARFSN